MSVIAGLLRAVGALASGVVGLLTGVRNGIGRLVRRIV
jgi:hypothetical protein